MLDSSSGVSCDSPTIVRLCEPTHQIASHGVDPRQPAGTGACARQGQVDATRQRLPRLGDLRFEKAVMVSQPARRAREKCVGAGAD